MRDPPAARVDQVRRRQLAYRRIVHAHEVRRQAVELAVDQHIRNFLLLQAMERLHRGLRGRHNQHVHPARQKLLDLLPLQFRVVLR